MKEPWKKKGALPGNIQFNYPGHMDDFVETDFDNGGVDINSGIPNRAFYVTATEIGGNSWEKAGLILYRALDKLGPLSQFEDGAKATVAVANELFGGGSREHSSVLKGWSTVGV